MEKQSIVNIFEEKIDFETKVKKLELELNKKIDGEDTIIFFDEIQESETLISCLKAFCESKKNYKIVCAGSLLGVKINRFKSSFPVGKVWIDYLYPMDFEEFLEAIGEEKISNEIRNCYNNMKPMLEELHKKALILYNDYLCIGGMPISIINYYITRYKPEYAIRISSKNFGISNNIKSIPLYASHLI